MASAPVLIKIKIADREYPLRVEAEEEALVREACRQLNEQLSAHWERFKIEDRQDLLAMVAFDVFIQRLLQEQQKQRDNLMLAQEVRRIDGVLAQALQG